MQSLRGPGPLATHWALDPAVCFLNHGSFGATPRVVLAAQHELRERMERDPVDFMLRFLPRALDAARERLGAFVGAETGGLAFSHNATTAVNGLLASFPLAAGDEVLVVDHAYNACRNAAEVIAQRSGARVVVARLPFPTLGSDALFEATLAAVTPRTRLALLDHVTSPTALLLPVDRLVPALRARGVECIVDGAHAPGMLPLDLTALGAWAYTGNLHKWVCAPKGAAFLSVRADALATARPSIFGHFAQLPPAERFRPEHDWLGTCDPTAWLAVPHALDVLESIYPGGAEEARRAMHDKVVDCRQLLCERLGVAVPCPEASLGSMATVLLPDRLQADAATLQERLWTTHQLEVPIIPWGNLGEARRWWVRVSMPPYARVEQAAFLADCLGA